LGSARSVRPISCRRPGSRALSVRTVFVGVEYYTDLGKIGDFLPFEQQRHQIFGVTDFKLGAFDIELGLGYGLTSGSDRLVAKAIIGYDFPVPGGAGQSSGGSLKQPLTMKAPPRQAPGLY
jgi:hypothetical protein